MATIDDVVSAICRIPLDARRGVGGPIDLAHRSGLLDHRAEVSVERLVEALTKDPALVDAWQDDVEDNRSTPAWYFRTLRPGVFEVGRIDRSGITTDRRQFDDRTRACAEYVLREVEQLAGYGEWMYRPWSAIRRRLSGRRR